MNMINTLKGSAAVRRMGAAAFAFFLVKGLLWVAAPFVFLWMA